MSRRAVTGLAGAAVATGIWIPARAAGPLPQIRSLDSQDTNDHTGAFETKDGGIVVTWDEKLYTVNQNISGEYSLYLSDANATNEYGYGFSVTNANYDWPNDPSSVDLAIEEWFSLGMDGVEIVDTWDADDAFAFFFTSDFSDRRGLHYFEYRYDDGMELPWISSAFGCTIGPDWNDVDQTGDYLEGVTLNDEAYPLVIDADELVDLIEEHTL